MRLWNPHVRPDEALRLAARILESEPWRVQRFLLSAGIQPTLTVAFDDGGETPNSFVGAPVDWPVYVVERRQEYEDDGAGLPPEEWRIHHFHLVLGDPRRPLLSAGDWGGYSIDLLEPYERSMEALSGL